MLSLNVARFQEIYMDFYVEAQSRIVAYVSHITVSSVVFDKGTHHQNPSVAEVLLTFMFPHLFKLPTYAFYLCFIFSSLLTSI
jgi:hypothetical protein